MALVTINCKACAKHWRVPHTACQIVLTADERILFVWDCPDHGTQSQHIEHHVAATLGIAGVPSVDLSTWTPERKHRDSPWERGELVHSFRLLQRKQRHAFDEVMADVIDRWKAEA